MAGIIDEDASIREGFLCPICKRDLGTVLDLQKHFDEIHSNEDKDVIDQLKGLFGKAKRKILGKEEEFLDEYNVLGAYESSDPDCPYEATYWEPQDIGHIRSHTEAFKTIRDKRIDRFVVETNKLLIRLDKLILDTAPTDPVKRKAYEKEVVTWAPNNSVKICTTCGRSFNLAKRRHHCRLCGCIICNACSHFLPYSYAKKLVNPSFRCDVECAFHRSSSSSSLNSMMDSDGELHIRTCKHCREALERRDQQVQQRNTKPSIVQLYEKMKIYMEEIDLLLPKFMDMSEALSAGETKYSLAEAQNVRLKVMKMYEGIDSLSKRIMLLGQDHADPPGPKTLSLQRSIRSHAAGFIQQNLMGLQGLPTDEEVQEKQVLHRQQVQKRLEEQKQAAFERAQQQQRQKEEKAAGSNRQANQSDQRVSTNSRHSIDHLSPQDRPTTLPLQGRFTTQTAQVTSTGWKPEVTVSARTTVDPMVQQMDIIRNYIRQAKQAGKLEEVEMLEQNLRDLQNEYIQQDQHNS